MSYFYPILLTALFLTGCSAKYPPLPTVSSLDLERYGGKWIEIARYENRFEQGCAGASADYTLKDGKIGVLNRCYDEKGSLTGEANGEAYATDTSNTKLKVTFFWPFYGDYHVIMLADDYRYSVVGEPSRRYLWILSRNPKLSDDDKHRILTELPQLGYNPSKLYWTTVQP
ncbi:MAG: lipocalin family protein [Sulfuricurvum sp.]|nr:lipocalin family protein [Sulfuricurvum sp.]